MFREKVMTRIDWFITTKEKRSYGDEVVLAWWLPSGSVQFFLSIIFSPNLLSSVSIYHSESWKHAIVSKPSVSGPPTLYIV